MTDTLPISFGDHTFIEEVHDGTLCGTCAYQTDRRKGMFIDVPNSWCWVAFADLYAPHSCSGPVMSALLAEKQQLGNATAPPTAQQTASPGMYTPRTQAVRGKAGVTACADQAQYLGTLVHGQAYHVLGDCKGECVWCYGDASAPVDRRTRRCCAAIWCHVSAVVFVVWMHAGRR